jgi:hypothetical protein
MPPPPCYKDPTPLVSSTFHQTTGAPWSHLFRMHGATGELPFPVNFLKIPSPPPVLTVLRCILCRSSCRRPPKHFPRRHSCRHRGCRHWQPCSVSPALPHASKWDRGAALSLVPPRFGASHVPRPACWGWSSPAVGQTQPNGLSSPAVGQIFWFFEISVTSPNF